MTPITGDYQFCVLQRHIDITGISGAGAIAYLVDLRRDGQLLLWDTKVGEQRDIPSHGLEVLPSRTLVELIHGHDSATTVEPLTDPAQQQRLEHLLGLASHRIARVALRLGAISLDPSEDRIAPTRREAARRILARSAIAVSVRGSTTAACLDGPPPHTDCAGLAADMNDGLGCLCPCHDTEDGAA